MLYLNLKPDCLGLLGRVTARTEQQGLSFFFCTFFFHFSVLLYTIPQGNDGGGELWVCFYKMQFFWIGLTIHHSHLKKEPNYTSSLVFAFYCFGQRVDEASRPTSTTILTTFKVTSSLFFPILVISLNSCESSSSCIQHLSAFFCCRDRLHIYTHFS